MSNTGRPLVSTLSLVRETLTVPHTESLPGGPNFIPSLEGTSMALDDIYQLLGIDTIVAVTKYSKQPTKLSTKKSPN